MKQLNIQTPFRMFVLLLGLFLSVGAFAQIDVKGHVKDAQGEPIIGATVPLLLKLIRVLTLPLATLAIRPRLSRPLLIWRLLCKTTKLF